MGFKPFFYKWRKVFTPSLDWCSGRYPCPQLEGRTKRDLRSLPIKAVLFFHENEHETAKPKTHAQHKPPKTRCAVKSQGFDINYVFMDVCRDHSLCFYFLLNPGFLAQEY